MILPLNWEGMNLPDTTQELLSKSLIPPPGPIKRYRDQKLAVVIPYRNRKAHLIEMIPHLKKTLKRDVDTFSIFIVEQGGTALFNRGKLFNSAVRLIRDSFDYFCFHDIDFVPLKVDYRFCPYPLRPYTFTLGDKAYPKEFDQSKLSAILENQFIPSSTSIRAEVYPHLFGGVILIEKEAFKKVGGYSEVFEFWGYEDLDFLLRCLHQGLWPVYDPEGTFRLLPHQHSLKGLDSDLAKKLVLKNMKHYLEKSKYLKFNEKQGKEFSLIQHKSFSDFEWLELM